MTGPEQLYNFLKSKGLITKLNPLYEPAELVATPETISKNKKEYLEFKGGLCSDDLLAYNKIFNEA